MTLTATIPSSTGKPEPKGIGGWLIFPALGTLVMPFTHAYGAFECFDLLLSWDGSAALGVVIGLEMVGTTAIAGTAAYGIFLLVSHSRWYPRLFIGLLAGSLGFNAADLAIAAGAFDISITPADQRYLARACADCLLWIPYMMRSRRVRNTFVN